MNSTHSVPASSHSTESAPHLRTVPLLPSVNLKPQTKGIVGEEARSDHLQRKFLGPKPSSWETAQAAEETQGSSSVSLQTDASEEGWLGIQHLWGEGELMSETNGRLLSQGWKKKKETKNQMAWLVWRFSGCQDVKVNTTHPSPPGAQAAQPQVHQGTFLGLNLLLAWRVDQMVSTVLVIICMPL